MLEEVGVMPLARLDIDISNYLSLLPPTSQQQFPKVVNDDVEV